MKLYINGNCPALTFCSLTLKINLKSKSAAFSEERLPEIPKLANPGRYVVDSEIIH
jgi:hypothetical protein